MCLNLKKFFTLNGSNLQTWVPNQGPEHYLPKESLFGTHYWRFEPNQATLIFSVKLCQLPLIIAGLRGYIASDAA